MEIKDCIRLVKLQERVRRSTLTALKDDGHHKSSEAMVSAELTLPGMFSNDREPYWTVMVWSYVLGPHRSHTWSAATLPEALAQAESDVAKWCFGYEMREFELALGGPPDPSPDEEPDEFTEQQAGNPGGLHPL